MKKLALILAMSLFAVSFAQADDTTCSNAELKQLAAKARDQVLRLYENLPDETLAVMDVSDAQVANCPAKYLPRTLGLATTAEVRPDVCGVRLKFGTAEAEKNFAAHLMLVGSKIQVHEGEEIKLVPLCGKVAQ